MRGGASRDGRQQSRLIRGDEKGFEICTIDHKRGGIVRLDATISYTDENHEVGVYAHGHDEVDEMGGDFLRVYSPTEGDECFVDYDNDGYLDATESTCVDGQTIAWWKLSCGRVLGVYDGRLIEYDPSTLAPLGMVVSRDELRGRRVAVIDNGYGGSACVLYDDDNNSEVTVVQPNEDGTYWRKVVRNKMHRTREMRNVAAAKEWIKEVLPDQDHDVMSSYGPYTSTAGQVMGISTKALPFKEDQIKEKIVSKSR